MLKTHAYRSLAKDDLQRLIIRNADPSQEIQNAVRSIIEEVKTDGDQALKRFTKQFDGIHLDKLYLEKEDIATLAGKIGREQQRALEIAFANIYRFHETQLRKERTVETMPGVKCWREPRPIEKVGLYVPGGSAVLPSTLLMLGVPARIAGCKEIVVCSPPQANGQINAYIAFCLQLLKI